jgi:hypothetical protein
MKSLSKYTSLAFALALASTPAFADDLLGTFAKGKGGVNNMALDLVTSGESVAFEFVIEVPKGATNVDVSKCLSTLPATHIGKCQYNDKTREIIAIAYSTTNAKLPAGALGLGGISYTSLQKGGSGATIRDLVVADGVGQTIQSEIRSEDAMLGNQK